MVSHDSLAQVVNEYQDEGYQVIVAPDANQLPAFVSGFPVDLLASRGGEHVIVEVKRNQRALQQDPQIQERAQVVNSQPNWRFDLVVLERQNFLEKFADDARQPSVDEIVEMLNRAESTARAGDLNAGYLLAWAGLEAAMRRAVSDANRYGRIAPLGLLGNLYSNGILSREEYDDLKRAYAIRTQLAHGLVPTAANGVPIDRLIATARNLLTVGNARS
ncbi:MAG TPA: hypothetical protein PK867_30605 [Pirellulales bacterium]|nr:hypothetical protein [Pirellulales bacterium]